MIQLFLKLKIKKREKIVKYLVKAGVGTQNLPDAIKWHFAYFWKHAISKDQLKNTKRSKKILEKYIAIPIYITLVEKITKKLQKTYQKLLIPSF